MLNRLLLLPLFGISSFLTCNIISVVSSLSFSLYFFFLAIAFPSHYAVFAFSCFSFRGVERKRSRRVELRLAKITVPGPMHVIFLAMSALTLRLCCRVCNYYEIQKLEIQKKKEKAKEK